MTKYEFEYNYGKKQKQFNKFLNSNQPDLIKQGMRKFFYENIRLNSKIEELELKLSLYEQETKDHGTCGLCEKLDNGRILDALKELQKEIRGNIYIVTKGNESSEIDGYNKAIKDCLKIVDKKSEEFKINGIL